MKIAALSIVSAAGALAFVGDASAVIEYDQDVTPDVIFGSGNANGGFTTDTVGSVELGLRAKVRFDENNLPQNVFNSNGDGTYTFQDGLPPTGFGFAAGSPSTATWNFEWSINSDVDGSGTPLDQLTYQLSIDFDPGAGTNFLSFDPINDINGGTGTVQWDHAIGTNATGNGGGTSIPNNTSDAAGYATAIATNNVAQNSWNMEFFDSATFPFDGAAVGIYTFTLSASDNSGVVASTSIDVEVVPEPTSLALLAIGGLTVLRRRR